MKNNGIDWSKYKSSNPTMKPNKMLIPVNNISFSKEGVEEFNKLYQYCLEKERNGEFHKRFILTKSQGISIAQGNIRGAMWLITVKKSMTELLIRNLDARYYRFIIGYKKEDVDKKNGMWGRKAFQLYKEELLADNVDLETLALDSAEEGLEVKKTIPSPKIDLLVAPERTYYNAHHMDLNSAFNAGMMKQFPQLETSVRRMYSKRKIDKRYKDVLNMTQGVLQSELLQYRFSHISKAGYVFTNEQIELMSEKLRNNGYRILSYNTDGIWYQGEKPYEDETFGKDIGQWKNDYINCKIRYKSKGAYEFVDGDGNYKPVVRGEMSVEKTKPRETWTWEDNMLFKSELVTYNFVEGLGFYRNVID